MRKLVWCLSAIVILLSGCFKKDTECTDDDNKVAPASEEQAVAAYLSANSIQATKHANNMYYQIVSLGSGEVPGPCASVTINYSGHTTTNTRAFDEGSNADFQLKALISGMKKGIPLIRRGGRIILYIPPSLGYGSNNIKDNNGTVIIPANSILIFDVTLVDFR
jgi:FKBP-type peptidyl-prolyl cis-trans isomerase FkpA